MSNPKDNPIVGHFWLDDSPRRETSPESEGSGSGFVGAPYRKESKTSRDAAVSVAKYNRNQREKAWIWIHSRGGYGSTAQEANAALGIKHNCCSRFTELRQLGRIEKAGHTRPTVTGRQAEVYVAIEPDDWTDKRPGWPCPRKPKKNDPCIWKQDLFDENEPWVTSCGEEWCIDEGPITNRIKFCPSCGHPLKVVDDE